MNTSIKSWLGQVTTGHGVMVLVPTLMSAVSGTMSWSQAAPLLVAGVVGLAWPENTALASSAQTSAADIANTVAILLHEKGGKTPA